MLCDELIPRIVELRASSDDPITVYLNSPGGSTRVLDILIGLLQSPDHNGIIPRVITVASGDAASAAAMFLAMGDYSIAYPHSIIHCHGVRLSEVQDLTTEDASLLAKQLDRRNREIALRVAQSCIKRLAHRFAVVSPRFEEIAKRPEFERSWDVELFVEAIRPFISVSAYNAARHCAIQAVDVNEIGIAVFDKVDKFKDTDSQMSKDVKVLREIIKFEVRRQKLKNCIDEDGLMKIVYDYLVLQEYFVGEHSAYFQTVRDNYGQFFLKKEEFAEYEETTKAGKEEEAAWWVVKEYNRILPFWYFAVLLSRKLQAGENRLQPEDAYWLGLVDEVYGTDLKGFRSFLEEKAQQREPELTPTTSAPIDTGAAGANEAP